MRRRGGDPVFVNTRNSPPLDTMVCEKDELSNRKTDIPNMSPVPCGSGGDDDEGFVCDGRTSVIDFSTDDRHGRPLCGAMHKCIFMEYVAVATDNSIFMVGFGSGIKMIEN